MSIGERIKETRKALNLTQKEFSSKLEFSPSYLSEIEKGVSLPGTQILISLYRNYKIDIAWLLTGEKILAIASAPEGAVSEERTVYQAGEYDKLKKEIESLKNNNFELKIRLDECRKHVMGTDARETQGVRWKEAHEIMASVGEPELIPKLIPK